MAVSLSCLICYTNKGTRTMLGFKLFYFVLSKYKYSIIRIVIVLCLVVIVVRGIDCNSWIWSWVNWKNWWDQIRHWNVQAFMNWRNAFGKNEDNRLPFFLQSCFLSFPLIVHISCMLSPKDNFGLTKNTKWPI